MSPVRRLLALVLLLALPAAADDLVRHDVAVRLDPVDHRLTVTDRITLPEGSVGEDGVAFDLHGGLDVSVGEGWQLLATDARPGSLPLTRYRVRPTGEPVPLALEYSGPIDHPLETAGEESARSFRATPGTIDGQGVYLSGTTRWLPTFGDAMVAFRVTVTLPAGWDAVCQGRRIEHRREADATVVGWASDDPNEEVYLIAGPWTEYSRPAGSITARAFLRTPDPGLAARYLEATAQYVQMYGRLLGPYPYDAFALVENFWETGYGMPSFTLLGPRIIRFPFILHSSYPHEILHNWWGNSVYVDGASGNWCEGLTAYLADHLIQEGRGRGEAYRRDTLKKYRSYVTDSEDFALRDFRSRHSGATEAVGYGKSLMFWHMLRRDLGDEAFVAGLRRFYRQNRFRRASFDDLAAAFGEAAGRDLAGVFEQWVDRVGAPALRLAVEPPAGDGPWRIRVDQVQEGEPYRLDVPVLVGLEGQAEGVALTARFAGDPLAGTSVLTLPAGARPTSVQVDPAFDVFRRLATEEIPPSIGDLFGAPSVTFVLPAAKDDPLDWKTLAAAWGGTVVAADELDRLPAGPVWILGSANRWADAIRTPVEGRGATLGPETLRFGDEAVERTGHSFVVTERHPDDPAVTVAWIGADVAAALPGLARKLPHYGKYSYLAFAGDEPTNVVKGQWSATDSPLFWRAEGHAGAIPTPAAAPPLARLEPVFDPAALRAHVDFLADDDLGGRGAGTGGLERAAEYIARAFAEAGLQPGGEVGSWYQTWTEEGGPDGEPVVLRNVVAVLPGTRDDWKEQSVVVGAHYDHLGTGWPDVRAGMEGQIHNGADDNASGVAVLIELAGLLARTLPRPDRTIVFVAFTGEEWGLKGSARYAATDTPWPAARATSIVNLDTVGRLAGRRLLVLGTGTATEWVHIVRGIGFTTGIEAVAVADDPGGSDQRTFHALGVPGVQLTTGPTEDYHRPTDDADKVDADGLVQIATWLREAVVYLAARPDPLTSTLEAGQRPDPGPRPGRRASVGTVPDFSDPGPGVRVDSIVPGSPAEKAGLRGGDRIVSIDGDDVADLRAYSQILRAHAPGDTIRIEVEREGRRLAVDVELGTR